MDRVRRFLASTPLRLAFAITALFVVVSVGSFAATYLVVRGTTEQALRATLEQAMGSLLTLENGDAVTAAVASRMRENSDGTVTASYVRPGQPLVGDERLADAITEPGPEWIDLDDEEESGGPDVKGREVEDGPFLAMTERSHGGTLSVAVHGEALEDMGEVFLAVLLYSLVPTTIIAIGGGAVLAFLSNRRIARIEATLDRLTSGDYAARVAGKWKRTDDLSRIGGRIDRMAEAQEKQIGALRQVSADIAHDLKTPIQRVSVLLDRLDGSADLTDDAAALVKRARAETSGIARTFQSLLQIAQIEGGSPQSRFVPVDLARIARTFVEIYEPTAEDARRTLTCSVPDGPIMVMGDKALLGQLFANLIENAMRHTPEGSPIEVSVERSGDGARIVVADRGPGIPAAERGNVLRRLYRLEASRSTPGNGLGLSLVEAVTDLHGGRLTLEDNEPGLRVAIDVPSI